MKSTPLSQETTVWLNTQEMELLLLDVHGHLAELLLYMRNQSNYYGWVHRRKTLLTTLAAKLEAALSITTTTPDQKETSKADE